MDEEFIVCPLIVGDKLASRYGQKGVVSVGEEVEFGGLVSVEINFYGLRVQIVLLSNSTGIWHVRSDQQQKKFSLESMMLMNTLRSPWSLVGKV